MILVFLLAFLLLSCDDRLPPPDMTDPGQLLFMGYADEEVNCSRCHGPEGQGSNDAPDIRRVFSKRDSVRIVEIIEEGTGDGPDDMPAFGPHLDEREVGLLFEYLKALQLKNPE